MTKFSAEGHRHELKDFNPKDDRDRVRFASLLLEMFECRADAEARTDQSIQIQTKEASISALLTADLSQRVHMIRRVCICAGCIRTAADKFREAAEHCDALLAMCTEEVKEE